MYNLLVTSMSTSEARAALLDDATRIHDLLAEAAATPLPEGTGLTEQRAEELIADIRASRGAR